jgi:hypothetical protein
MEKKSDHVNSIKLIKIKSVSLFQRNRIGILENPNHYSFKIRTVINNYDRNPFIRTRLTILKI